MLEVQERRDRKIREEEVYRDSAKVVKRGQKLAIYILDLS